MHSGSSSDRDRELYYLAASQEPQRDASANAVADQEVEQILW